MSVYLVSYEITDADDGPLLDQLEEMGATRVMRSQWMIASRDEDPGPIYKKLAPLLKEPDRILVLEVFRVAHWDNLLVGDWEFREFLARNARQ